MRVRGLRAAGPPPPADARSGGVGRIPPPPPRRGLLDIVGETGVDLTEVHERLAELQGPCTERLSDPQTKRRLHVCCHDPAVRMQEQLQVQICQVQLLSEDYLGGHGPGGIDMFRPAVIIEVRSTQNCTPLNPFTA